MQSTISAVSPLRQRMLEDMRLRKLAPKTQSAYVRAVRKFTQFLWRQSITSSHLTVSQSRYIIANTEDSIMAHSTMLHVRVDDEIKTQASEALAAMGLSVSDAVRILLKRVVNDQAFPLELKVPNAQTRAAMEEARAMAKARAARFESADTLIDDLEKTRQQ
jgi:DNA-damage-inducible protein J